MRLPRNISAAELIKALGGIGYQVSRQKGSHIRLTCSNPRVHHITIPNHNPIKIGTLAAILSDVAAARNQDKDSLIAILFQ